MDAKRPDVRVDDRPDEDGVVTTRRKGGTDDDEGGRLQRAVETIADALRR